MKKKLINNDCLLAMKEMPDNSIDAIVTDPPYGLSFMGKKWDYDVPSQEIWEECLRVLKPGGYLLSFAGTRTQHRMAVRIEDAGFEIRDMIAWVYGSGFPKSLNIGKAVDKIQGNERIKTGEIKHHAQKGVAVAEERGAIGGGAFGQAKDEELTKGTSEWEGWGTSLKPALEPITVARKPLEKGLNIAQNCLKWGVGGINIDESRVGTEDTRQKTGGAIEGSGWGTKGGAIAGSELGRFPANLIHDGSDEVVGLFPQTGKSSGGRIGNKGSALNMMGNNYEAGNPGFGDSGSAARFFYCAKASKSERNRGLDEFEPTRHADRNIDNGVGGDNPRNRTNTPKKNFHPTVKPIALMEYLVKLVSKEGHTVLDPFMGSGSTGIACKKLGREFIGIELDADYCKIAEARINGYKVSEQETLL
jgi:DNA modification methylase